MKFEVGDTVKVVRMDIFDDGYLGVDDQLLCLGKNGTVECINYELGVMTVKFEHVRCSINPKWVELVERKRKPYHGKVVCVENDFGFPFFKTGKVYQVVNGKLYDESKHQWQTVAYSIEDINHTMNEPWDVGLHFIEFKGYADTGKEKNE